MSYKFATKPFSHQKSVFEASREMPAFAVFWEQGTGKTKLAIDQAAYLFQEGEIDGVFVVAPNAVHRGWISADELGKHCPGEVLERSVACSFQSEKKGTQWHRKMIREFFEDDGFKWLTISYSGFMTKEGKKVAWDYLRNNRILMVLDESANIKNPDAKRTKSMIAAGAYPAYKRILDGTPVGNSAFDTYAQIRFLDPGFWKQHGINTSQMFKHYFGIWSETKEGRPFPVGYQNLHLMREWLKPISSRVLKKDVLDLPPKLYKKVRFELTPEQRRIYEQLETEYRAVLASGEEITAELTIVRQLRLQQVACGYLPTEDVDEPVHMIGKRNPRMDVMCELLENLPHPAIIWARFRLDIDQLMERLGERAVRFDGSVGGDDREVAKAKFNAGDYQFFVANTAVGGAGLTLNTAKSMFYYSNSFSVRERKQSEDRNHRIGQDTSVLVTDLIAENTVDEHIVDSLRKNHEVACEVTGDEVLEWL